jgi:hypothetical protein
MNELLKLQESHTAGAHSAGYDYQFYYFVYLALDLKPGQSIGFEIKDDIHIDKKNGTTILFQTKHTVSDGNLTTLDSDLWKTLSNWTDFIKNAENLADFLEKHSFVLVTNKNENNNRFIDTLVQFQANPNPNIDSVKNVLADLKKTTNNNTIKQYIHNVNSLGKSKLKSFFAKLFVETNTDNIIELIKRKILETTRQESFVDSIFDSLISNILAKKYLDIKYRNKFEISREDFDRQFGKCFSVAFVKQSLPKRNYPLLDFNNLDHQTFIKQLFDIEDLDKDRDRDIQLILKYTTQMLNTLKNFSDWLDSCIILPTDIDEFEKNNITMWQIEFRSKYRHIEKLIHEKSSISELENDIKNLGVELIDYLRRQDLSISGFQPLGLELSNGHFYALSDELKIGWHYDWENKYKKK